MPCGAGPSTMWTVLASRRALFRSVAGGQRPPLLGKLPDARWFPSATTNYAEHLLRRRDEHVALVARSEDGSRRSLTYAALAEQVARARAGLLRVGVKRGDRVAAFLPNGIEAVVGLLASASLGAIWSSAPRVRGEERARSLQQIEPSVLLACDGYTYGGKPFRARAELREIGGARPSLRGLFCWDAPTSGARAPLCRAWSELVSQPGPLDFEAVPFEHPLWILYSSGTTGLPKPIVQGHGGILLEHLKTLALHIDLAEGDRFFWFSTTGWMMWNILVSALALGSTLVLYDGACCPRTFGAVEAGGARRIFTRTSAPYLLAARKRVVPKNSLTERAAQHRHHRRALPSDGFEWVTKTGFRRAAGSLSGGTDACTAFVLSCPLLPVRAGEIQCRGLGAKVEAWDDHGKPLVDSVGELVLTEPLPSMPLGFWNDPARERFKSSYFDMYPGVWRHGDWIKLDTRGAAVIYGRSDSTLNRGGVRMGTSEFYRIVEGCPKSPTAWWSTPVRSKTQWAPCGSSWCSSRTSCSTRPSAQTERRAQVGAFAASRPRRDPSRERGAAHAQRQELEVPVKRILLGADPEKVASRDTLANPRRSTSWSRSSRG